MPSWDDHGCCEATYTDMSKYVVAPATNYPTTYKYNC